MILRDNLKKHIKDLGKINKAWFTTFNLDVSFFETYVLPLLLGEEKVPKTRRDYESMQLAISDGKVDVRIFCDQRMLDAGANKKTAVPVHDITMTALKSIEASGVWGEEGIFHPKVIYIEGENGAILGSGSSNLTVSGWGRNREVFLFQDTWSNNHVEQLEEFFSPLFSVNKLALPEIDVGDLSDNASWMFVHSFQEKPFLEQFFFESPEKLYVFSPYFSSDLASLLGKLRKASGTDNLPIGIVPDFTATGLIRTKQTEALLQQLQKGFEDGGTALFNSPDFIKKGEMVHAKLWWTSKRLAIGSWNLTGPGANISGGKTNNIEAGFVIPSPASFWKKKPSLIKYPETLFMNEEQLDAVSLKLPPALDFTLQVTFDWKLRCYVVNYDAPKGIHDAFLRLPDIPEPIPLSKYEGTGEFRIPVESNVELLRRRLYVASDSDGSTLEGYIVEVGAELRPVLQHNDLSELLDSLVFAQFGIDNQRSDYRADISTDDIEDEDDTEPLPEDKDDIGEEHEHKLVKLTYYRLFKAMKNMHMNLKNLHDDDEFIKNAIVYPGSVKELVDKADEMQVNDNIVFRWFFTQEVNKLVETVNKRLAKIDKNIIQLKLLKETSLPNTSKDSPRQKFINYVLKECGYDAR